MHIDNSHQGLPKSDTTLRLTRRQFLRAALAGGTTLLLPALAACDSGPAQPTPAAVATSAPPPTAVAAATSAPPPTDVAAATSTPVAACAPPAIGASFPQPATISSVDGQLNTALAIAFQELPIAVPTPTPVATFALRTIGVADPNDPSEMIWGYPGPTLRVKPGDRVQVLVQNNLNQSPVPTPTVALPQYFGSEAAPVTNIHYHGLHVTPVAPGDDILHIDINAGTSYQYDFTIPDNHPGGTYWYHPHYHGASAIQVSNGVAGALIVEGDFDCDNAPEIAEAKDVVLVLQGITPDPNGPNAVNILVNGQYQPTIQMQPAEVQRWRFIGATMQLSAIVELELFSASEPEKQLSVMYQIAQDGIQFTNDQWSTTPQQSFLLAPGNRSDFLVQAPLEPGRYLLRGRRTSAPDNIQNLQSAALPTPTLPPLEAAAVLVLEVVSDSGSSYPKTLPQQLPAYPARLGKLLSAITDEEIAGRNRSLVFNFANGPEVDATPFPGPPTVGTPPAGTAFPTPPPETPFPTPPAHDHDVMPVHSMVLNTAEEWTLYNITGVVHPFHIHVNSVVVTKVYVPTTALAAGPAPAAAPEATPLPGTTTAPMRWQDTILIPPAQTDPKTGNCIGEAGYVVIRHRFTDFIGQYVLHCHNLLHEDQGMMQAVEVVPSEQDVPAGTGWQDHQKPAQGLIPSSCKL
jgi:FtsP/CotA-like multicopper oxidase with cupredoxin domain